MFRTDVSITEPREYAPTVITTDAPIRLRNSKPISTGTYAEVRMENGEPCIMFTEPANRIERFLLVLGDDIYMKHFFDQHHKQVMELIRNDETGTYGEFGWDA